MEGISKAQTLRRQRKTRNEHQWHGHKRKDQWQVWSRIFIRKGKIRYSLKAKKRNLIGQQIEGAINPQGAANIYNHAGMNTHTEDGINPNPLPRTANELKGSNHSATSNSSLNNTVSTIRNANGCLNRTQKKKKTACTHKKYLKKDRRQLIQSGIVLLKGRNLLKGLRGIVGLLKQPQQFEKLGRLCRDHNPNFLFILETTSSEIDIKRISKRLKFDNLSVIPTIGPAGGLALLCQETIELYVLLSDRWYLHCNIKSMNGEQLATFIQGPPNILQRNPNFGIT